VPDDGVEFRAQSVTSRVIRGEDLYSGVRVAMDCALASAIVKLRLDVNFGTRLLLHRRRLSYQPFGSAGRRLAYWAIRSKPFWLKRSRQQSLLARPTRAFGTMQTCTR
jgi:hypothetical protein